MTLGGNGAKLFFVLLFPFLFFYKALSAFGYIPPLIGKGFGPMVLLAVIVMFPLLLLAIGRMSVGRYSFWIYLFLAFVSYVAICIGVNYLLGGVVQSEDAVIDQALATLLSWMALFAIGFFWSERMAGPYLRLLQISLVCMGLIILWKYSPERGAFNPAAEVDGTDTYQEYARALAYTGMFVTIHSRKKLLQYATILLVLVELFFCGARSELIAFLAVVPMIYWLNQRKFATLKVVAGCLVAAFLLIALPAGVMGESRQSDLGDLQHSSSWQARLEYTKKAVETISSNPLFGDFGSHAEGRGYIGKYAHNALSAWVAYGLIGFLIYLSLVLGGVICALRRVLVGVRDVRWNLALVLGVYGLIMAVGSKPVFWPFVAIGWGVFARAVSEEAIARRRK